MRALGMPIARLADDRAEAIAERANDVAVRVPDRLLARAYGRQPGPDPGGRDADHDVEEAASEGQGGADQQSTAAYLPAAQILDSPAPGDVPSVRGVGQHAERRVAVLPAVADDEAERDRKEDLGQGWRGRKQPEDEDAGKADGGRGGDAKGVARRVAGRADDPNQEAESAAPKCCEDTGDEGQSGLLRAISGASAAIVTAARALRNA
jgi:hypothetical protein